MLIFDNSLQQTVSEYNGPLDENKRLELYKQHRARVQNAKSVVNSRPHARVLVTIPKELSFCEMLSIVRSAVQQNGNVSPCTFTKAPLSIRPKITEQMDNKNWPAGSNNDSGDGIFKDLQSVDCYSMNISSPAPQKPLGERVSGLDRSWKSFCFHNPADHMCTHHAAVYGKKINVSAQTKCTPRGSKVKNIIKRRSRIELYKPVNRSGSIMSLPNQRRENKENKKIPLPEHLLKRFELLTMCNNLIVLRKLLRPKVFFDLEVENYRPLGRLTIQLYTEACPEVVLEFINVCVNQRCNYINLSRLFPPLWMEGELYLSDNKSLTGQNIEHDPNVLDHGSSSGILSFPSRYMRGSKLRNLTFSISFKPLKVLNGKRIAFGCVKGGHSILDIIQDYGTNTGRPKRNIIVKECGLL